MKTLFTLVFVASITAETVLACEPFVTRQPKPGSNCTQVQVCNKSGKGFITINCGVDTVCNQDIEKCTSPAQVNLTSCRNITAPPPCEPFVTRQPKPGSNCTQFQVCDHNGDGFFTFDCGNGTVWNQDIETCTYPEKVNLTSCRTITAPPRFQSCVYGKYEGDTATGCQKYKTCGYAGSWAEPQECPPNSSFVDRLQICLPSSVVNIWNCTINSTSECSQQYSIRGIMNCTEFQLCESYGVWSEPVVCPPGTLFNTAVETCDYEHNINPKNCSAIA